MKKLLIILTLLIIAPIVVKADINVIDKISPKNDAFQGLIDADQIIDNLTTFGNWLVSDGTYFTSTTTPTDLVTPDMVLSTGKTDENCLTYESTGDAWEWQSCGTGGGGGVDGFDFSYNQDIGYGVTGAATTTPVQFALGIHASSTSHFDNATTTLFTAVGGWFTDLWIGAQTLAQYILAQFTGGTGITLLSGDISFDCSEVEGTGINCSGEAITLDDTSSDTEILYKNGTSIDGVSTFTYNDIDLTIAQGIKLLLDDSDKFLYSDGTDLFLGTNTGTTTLGVDGDIEIGGTNERTLRPAETLKVNLGQSNRVFNEIWGNEIHLQQSVADVSNPPTDAQLDSIFGTPAALGRGACFMVDDNIGVTALYLVCTNDTSWGYLQFGITI